MNIKKEIELDRALALLIANTKRKKRLCSLVEISENLNFALKELGTYRELSNRIGLSETMLRQFNGIDRLSPKVKALFQKRVLDSVDAVSQISIFPFNEQEFVVKELAQGNIDTLDIRAILSLWKKNTGAPIADLVQKVAESKNKKYFVAEFVIKESLGEKDLLPIFEKEIPSEQIVKLEVDGSLGRLIINGKGKKSLQNLAKKRGVRLSELISLILREHRKDGDQ